MNRAPALPSPVLAAALLAALLASAGCAAMRGDPRARRLEAALDASPIGRPLDEIWPEVRRLLSDRGFGLAGKDAEAVGQESHGWLLGLFSVARESESTPQGGRLIRTAWNRRQLRYLVEALPAGPGWRVRFTLVQEDPTEHGRDGAARRDADAELELVRRVAPEQAAAILEGMEAPASYPSSNPSPNPAVAPIPAPAPAP